MARCRELGWFPEDDNCADALGILNYALTVHEAIKVPWAQAWQIGKPKGKRK